MAKAKKKFDEDFKKMILDLNQSGQSVEELAEQYGIASYKEWSNRHDWGRNPSNEKGNGPHAGGKHHPKKGFNHIRSKVKMSDVFEFIQSNVHDHDIKQMCTVLKAPKSSYYDWKKKKPSKRQ